MSGVYNDDEIAEQLRAAGHESGAEAIERLRAEVERLRAEVEDAEAPSIHAERDAMERDQLRAEVERLRAAGERSYDDGSRMAHEANTMRAVAYAVTKERDAILDAMICREGEDDWRVYGPGVSGVRYATRDEARHAILVALDIVPTTPTP